MFRRLLIGLPFLMAFDWGNNAQWWSKANAAPPPPPCVEGTPGWPFCSPPPNLPQVLQPWDQPSNAITIVDTLFLVQPKVGVYGTVAQRLKIWTKLPPIR